LNNSTNKKAIVTGAGRGIGRSISISLAKDGYDVALISRIASKLESVAIEIEKYGRKRIQHQSYNNLPRFG